MGSDLDFLVFASENYEKEDLRLPIRIAGASKRENRDLTPD